MKRFQSVAIFTFTVLVLSFAGCTDSQPTENANQSTDQEAQAESTIQVAATFYPLAEFAQKVGGDSIQVTNVTKTGTDPHDYEPTPRDLITVYESDLFLINGGGQDPWAEDIHEELESRQIMTLHMAEEIVEVMPMEDEHEEEEDDEHDELDELDEHDHDFDPHIWLDPMRAAQQVEAIKDALIQIDPEGAANYEQNAANYIAQLTKLDETFTSGLQSCERRDFIVAHEAFGYLANRYDLNQIAISGLSPQAEPSAKKLAEIADQAQQTGATHIFFETLTSPALSETIANEIGAQTLVLNPIEGLTQDQLTQGLNYGKLMEENLRNLQLALNCEKDQENNEENAEDPSMSGS